MIKFHHNSQGLRNADTLSLLEHSSRKVNYPRVPIPSYLIRENDILLIPFLTHVFNQEQI